MREKTRPATLTACPKFSDEYRILLGPPRYCGPNLYTDMGRKEVVRRVVVNWNEN